MFVRGLIIIAVSMSFFFFNLKTLESEGEGAMAIRVIIVIGNLVGMAFVYFGGKLEKQEQGKKARAEEQINEKHISIAVTPSQQRELRLRRCWEIMFGQVIKSVGA